MTKVKIGIVQTACSADVASNMEHTLTYLQKVVDKGAQIICLQEMYRTLYFCQTQDYEHFKLAETIPGPSTELFSKFAKEHGVVIVAPLFEKRVDGIYHNTIVVIDADGSTAGIYRKMHIPHDPGFEEKFYFTPGDLGFKAIKTKYATIGTLICWDQWYPEAARLTAMKGAQIIFYPTAIGWDAKEPKEVQNGQLDAWRTIQRAHSIANGCYVCAVNRVGTEGDLSFWGNSFVSDPLGRIMDICTKDQEETRVVEIDLNEIDNTRTHWPFFRDRRIDAYSDLTKRYSD
ncbi:MAG: carbon-nitrogen hydrolase [Bacteroidota bacterium]|nr:carbon-nitrogen hydrolase [Bacteroidota bacterium]